MPRTVSSHLIIVETLLTLYLSLSYPLFLPFFETPKWKMSGHRDARGMRTTARVPRPHTGRSLLNDYRKIRLRARALLHREEGGGEGGVFVYSNYSRRNTPWPLIPIETNCYFVKLDKGREGGGGKLDYFDSMDFNVCAFPP